MLRTTLALLLLLPGCYAPHGTLQDYGPSGWRAGAVTAGAEMAPVAAAVGLRPSERCVLRHAGLTLRAAVARARAEGCDAGEAEPLAARRCLVHAQQHAACLDNTATDAYARFWHDRDGHRLSTGDSVARLADAGFADLYLWGDSATVGDVYFWSCELLRAGFAVDDRDAAEMEAALKDAVAVNATLHHWIRLPLRSLEARRARRRPFVSRDARDDAAS